MRVGEEHEVYLRQVSDAQTGMTEAAQDDQAAGEDGVDEYIAASDLDEERRMSNERDAKLGGWCRDVLLLLSRNGVESGLADEPGELPELVNFGGVTRIEVHGQLSNRCRKRTEGSGRSY